MCNCNCNGQIAQVIVILIEILSVCNCPMSGYFYQKQKQTRIKFLRVGWYILRFLFFMFIYSFSHSGVVVFWKLFNAADLFGRLTARLK